MAIAKALVDLPSPGVKVWGPERWGSPGCAPPAVLV